MSRMSEMSHAMQDYCNENYGPEDIPPPEADRPCGGWDCSGSPGGPMPGCPYFEPASPNNGEMDGKLLDHAKVATDQDRA